MMVNGIKRRGERFPAQGHRPRDTAPYHSRGSPWRNPSQARNHGTADEPHKAPTTRDKNRRHVLTGRELEVLWAIARGSASKEIALELGISERTVKAHIASIFSRLGVDSRASAIAAAAQLGLLDQR